MTTLRDSPSGPLVALISSTSDVDNQSAVAGATASLALDTLETRMRALEVYEVLETFQGGLPNGVAATNQIGGIGEHSWSFLQANSAVSLFNRPNSIKNQLGRYTISTGTSGRCGFMLGSSGTPAPGIGLLPTQIVSVEWSAAPDTSSGLNGKYRWGFGTNTSLSRMGTDGIFFEADDSIAGDTWRCIARKSNVEVVALTGITWKPNGTYAKLGIFRETNGDFRFELNDVVVGLIAAVSIPTTRIVAACQCEATVNSGQSLEFDTCRLRYRRL